jgi:hypothetical protein
VLSEKIISPARVLNLPELSSIACLCATGDCKKTAMGMIENLVAMVSALTGESHIYAPIKAGTHL